MYIATQIQVTKQTLAYATPASLGAQYRDVTFPSRYDHVQLQGWFIPGVLPTGQLTSQRAIIMVHGNGNNRAEKSSGLLNLSVDLAAAARSVPGANVQTWLAPGATHAQAYHVEGKAYVDRIVAFYTAALGADTSAS